MSATTLRGLRIGIVGASVAGLATARFLRGYGAEVELFERSQARLESRGGGIAMDPDVVPLLGSPRGNLIEGRVVLGQSGRKLWTRPARKFMTAWSEVYSALHAHVPETIIHRGRTATHCESQPDGIVLHFDEGSSATFDLVVGADGTGSVVRQTVAPDFQPEYLGYVAIRGTIEEPSLPDACDPLRQWADHPGLVNCYGPRTHLVAYWVPSGSGKALNWMWYRNVAPRDLPQFMSDATGTTHHWSLPPGLLPNERRNQLLCEMADLFPEPLSAAAEAGEKIYLQSIYKGVPARLTRGNIILVGDAAHVAVPHIGAGTSFAIQDAASLAEAISTGDLQTALHSWAEKRRSAAESAMAISAALGHALQHEDHDWENWTPREFDNWWDSLVGCGGLYFDRRSAD
ncbi:MAG: FAD-dependent monooxygenase [Chthoniobacterales bacterium]